MSREQNLIMAVAADVTAQYAIRKARGKEGSYKERRRWRNSILQQAGPHGFAYRALSESLFSWACEGLCEIRAIIISHRTKNVFPNKLLRYKHQFLYIGIYVFGRQKRNCSWRIEWLVKARRNSSHWPVNCISSSVLMSTVNLTDLCV